MTKPEPTTIWPRKYLLDIYAAAIRDGFVWIKGLTPEQAASLRLAIYRLRRRSDKNNAAFITPAHHLVTVGTFDAERGWLPVLFDKMPEMDLPEIASATPAEAASYFAPAPEAEAISIDSAEVLKSAAEIELTEIDISSYVERMKRRAKEQSND